MLFCLVYLVYDSAPDDFLILKLIFLVLLISFGESIFLCEAHFT